VTYPGNDMYRCSATVVSPYVVLTAGHCVHNKDRGGFITAARVYPGQNQSVVGDGQPIRPYGVKTDISSAQTTAMWTQISGEDSYNVIDYRHDFAAIQFKTPFTFTSTFMPVLYGSTGSPVTNVGYPANVNDDSSKTAFGQYAQNGNETSNNFLRNNHVREFAVDATGGNSGGPFFFFDSSTGQRYLVGLLSYGNDLDDEAGGPWYDSWNQSLVSGWVSWTPGAAAAGSVNGLRVASVFSSAQASLFSFLRFYNSGTTAGTVEVTLSDYTTGNILATWMSPSLPGLSARQFPIAEIEDNASTTFTKPMVYSVSVRPTFTGTFQNVVLRKLDGTISNVSTCDTIANSQRMLMNVHSSILQNSYPSAVVIHNTSTTSLNTSFGVYNSMTGQRLGTYTPTAIPANSQRVVTAVEIEANSGVSPTAGAIYQYNIRADSTFTGYLQHLVNNAAAAVIVDMTEGCTLTP